MITLFQFQEEAAASIAARVSEYLDDPIVFGRKSNRHEVPFFQALSALTGAGKTVVLAAAAAHIAGDMPVAPVILWLSRGKVVVQQAFGNLSPGGKYHHLLDNMSVQALADYSADDVMDSDRPLVYFATVGTFNQKDKENGKLRVHQSDVDVLEKSIWTALSDRLDAAGNRRPLVIVYDEGHNLSDQQTELLMELEPDVFLPATATMRIPARLNQEIDQLKHAGWSEEQLATKIKTSDVVAAGLVKETVLLEGYNSPMEETVASLLAGMKATKEEAATLGVDLRPKAIYVSDTNTVAGNPNLKDDPKQPFGQRQAPPILIWRYLTEQCGVDPEAIAVYADLKVDKDHPLPGDFVLYSGGDSDYEEFTAGDYEHVIFNLRLQEGWDDPSVYFAYIDKSMGSRAQVMQVVGRVLRQPEANHYPSDLLNTAHFYVRVDKNSVFNDVIEEVEKELGGEPGGIRIVAAAPGKPKPVVYPPKDEYVVPETALESAKAKLKVEGLLEAFGDYRNDVTNTKGVGSRRILRQKVGASSKATEWEEFEQASTASARWVFHREVQRQFATALGVANLADPKLDAVVGIGSYAFQQVCKLAQEVVETYIDNVRIKQRKPNPYKVGSVLAQPDKVHPFKHALHEGYAGMNEFERQFAESLDKTGLPWARNPARSGFGIPLISVGPTRFFYPDFLIWTDDRVICADTKGSHLILETAARKLLRINHAGAKPRLDIQFTSMGKYDKNLEHRDRDGYTSWGLGDDGQLQVNHYGDLDELVRHLIDDSLNSV